MIRRVRLYTDDTSGTALTNASFRIHFYTASPTQAGGASANTGDNAALSTNQRAGYLGSMDVTLSNAFTDGAWGAGVPTVGSEIAFSLSSGQTLYVLVEARGAYTPTSGETFSIAVDIWNN